MPNDHKDIGKSASYRDLPDVLVRSYPLPKVFPQIIESCSSCGCGVDCTTGDQHYCNRCEHTICDDFASCHMTDEECSLIPKDEVWCTECARKIILAAAQLMRDMRVKDVRCA